MKIGANKAHTAIRCHAIVRAYCSLKLLIGSVFNSASNFKCIFISDNGLIINSSANKRIVSLILVGASGLVANHSPIAAGE